MHTHYFGCILPSMLFSLHYRTRAVHFEKFKFYYIVYLSEKWQDY